MNGKSVYDTQTTLKEYIYWQLNNAKYEDGHSTDCEKLAEQFANLVDFLADKGIIQQDDLTSIIGWNDFEMEEK